MEPVPSSTELLRGADLRVTAIRTAVLDTLVEQPHADAEAIRAGVTRRVGSVAVQSVYDALNTLREAGLLRRIEPAGHPARYEVQRHDNHHHLVCRQCGSLADVPCAQGSQPCLQPGDIQGFVVDEAEVVYWGRCAGCASW